MWTVNVVTRSNIPIARVGFDEAADAHKFWLDLKMAGRFTKAVHSLTVMDPSGVCRFSYQVIHHEVTLA